MKTLKTNSVSFIPLLFHLKSFRFHLLVKKIQKIILMCENIGAEANAFITLLLK